MKSKELWVTALSLAAVVAVGVLAYRFVSRPRPDACQICERPLHHGVNYRLVRKDGTDETACCPRCGLHLQAQRPDDFQQAWATDMASSQMVRAETAWYVEGGDIEYCTMHSPRVQREPQGVSVRDYDRCLPTVVAFQTPQAAAAYSTEHGGRVLEYAQVMESVKGR